MHDLIWSIRLLQALWSKTAEFAQTFVHKPWKINANKKKNPNFLKILAQLENNFWFENVTDTWTSIFDCQGFSYKSNKDSDQIWPSFIQPFLWYNKQLFK